MHRVLCTLGVLLLLALKTGPVSASELRLALGGWDYDLSGQYNDSLRDRDLERDLAVRPRDQGSVSLDYEWRDGRPDLAAAFVQIGARGRSQENVPVGIGPVPIGSASTTLDSVGDFTDLEFSARWPLSRGALRFSPGLVLKHLGGEIQVFEDGVEVSRQDVDVWFPQPLARLDWKPSRYVRINTSAQGIAYDGDHAVEWQASAELALGVLLVQAGWQEKSYRVHDDDSELDVQLRGPVFRVGLSF